MNRFFSFFVLLLISSGCALTAPDGKKELLSDIENDRNQRHVKQSVFEGQPIFVRVRAYPQINDGNVYGKQWILMQIGRQKIDLPQIINDVEEE